MKIIFSMHQNQGKREYQQDAMAIKEFGSIGTLVILADGMGGYKGGEVASNIIRETFMDMKLDSNIQETLQNSLNLANSKIEDYKKENRDVKNMGSTLIAFFITEKSYQWISVGDSPLYRIRDGKIDRINKNHSIGGLIELKLKKGVISQKEADEAPNKHMLTSAVTGEELNLIDLSKEFDFQKGDIFIIASDGIETLTTNEINKIVFNNLQTKNQESFNKTVQILIEDVLKKDSKNQDNVTAIIIGVEDTIPPKEPKKEINKKESKKNILSYIKILMIIAILSLIVGFVYLKFKPQLRQLILDTNQTSKNIDTNISKEDNKTKTSKDIDKNISKEDNKTKTSKDINKNSTKKENKKLKDVYTTNSNEKEEYTTTKGNCIRETVREYDKKIDSVHLYEKTNCFEDSQIIDTF